MSSPIKNIKTFKALRGEAMVIDLKKSYTGTLTAWMKRDPNDLEYRSFDIVENRYLALSKEKASDYYNIEGKLLSRVFGKWYFDVERIPPGGTEEDVETIYTGTIYFANDITNSGGVEITDPNSGNQTAPIPITYPSITELVAGQANQKEGWIYEVEDASGFPDVEGGRLWVRYSGTTAGSSDDYTWEPVPENQHSADNGITLNDLEFELGGFLNRDTHINTTDKLFAIYGGGGDKGYFHIQNTKATVDGFGSAEFGIADSFSFLTSGFRAFSDKFQFETNYGKGIEYAADYSASYTDRSLVDKAFVEASIGGISDISWSIISDKPTTIGGYGITDFYSLGDARWVNISGVQTITGAKTFSASTAMTGAVSMGQHLLFSNNFAFGFGSFSSGGAVIAQQSGHIGIFSSRTDGYPALFNTLNLTSTKTFELPDESGVIALVGQSYTDTEVDLLLNDYQLLSEKGEVNGYTPLDSGAKIPIEFLPDSVIGQVEYQGTWNASTNTPDVGDSTLAKGHYYVVSVDGNYLGISYQAGDWIISNGVEWQKVDNTDAVTTVFGRIGPIVANSSDYAAFYEPIFNKNTAFNKNFGTTTGTVAEGNDSRINNGQTAFGWGDHALAGYITPNDIFQPNQLIKSIPPTRLINTFTYPAEEYEAIINKVLVTNPYDFETTIEVATASHKRVDLVYLDSDGILGKVEGDESLTVAVRPDLPADSVAVSFINVFGTTIDDPTPVTQEISIQDVFGVEQFKVTDYLRFEGVSVNPAQKLISINPLVPLSAFLDVINGNDITGAVENSEKPFKTIEALLNSLPETVGETYTIYIQNTSVVSFVRQVSQRNITWVSSQNVSLDFTNVKLDDGVTDALDVFKNALVSTWTFNGENISLRCLSGTKRFAFNSVNYIIIKGYLSSVNWNSQSFIGLHDNSDFTISSLNNYTSSTRTFKGRSNISIRVKVVRLSTSQSMFEEVGANSNLIIDSITQVVSMATIVNYVAGIATLDSITVGKVTMNGTLACRAKRVNYNNTTISDTTVMNYGQNIIHSGKINSLLYGIIPFTTDTINFLDFIGKIGSGRLSGTSGKLIFDNCSIEVDNYLFNRDVGFTGEYSAEFYRYNKITQINTSRNLFESKNSTSEERTPIKILIAGALTSNVKNYGKDVTAIYNTGTFKEKLNEIVIRSKVDLVNIELNSSTNYIVDGILDDLISTDRIIVPEGGLSLSGYGFDVSSIKALEAGSIIFSSPVDGCGNLFLSNISLEASGGGSKVFDLTNAGAPTGGADAIELNVVNFDNCDSIGELTNFRQGLWNNIGVFGVKDGLTFSGVWSGGFRSDLTIVRNFGITDTESVLFKEGTDLLFKSRFWSDLNADFKNAGLISNFAPSNFNGPNLYQLKGAQISKNGVIDDSVNYTDAITAFDSVCDWSGNNGIKNSNLHPYGLNIDKLKICDDDADAGSNGIEIGETYIESSTGYFKARLS